MNDNNNDGKDEKVENFVENNELNLQAINQFRAELQQAVARNRLNSFSEAKKLSSKDHPHGHYLLASYYRYGYLVEKNVSCAFELLRKAADQQHAAACCVLVRSFLGENKEFGQGYDLERAKYYVELGLSGQTITHYDNSLYSQSEHIKELQELAAVIEMFEEESQIRNCLVM